MPSSKTPLSRQNTTEQNIYDIKKIAALEFVGVKKIENMTSNNKTKQLIQERQF